jgi:ribulose-5-phosphate 4-epimerase/fuculose-1-phosphate aldolase
MACAPGTRVCLSALDHFGWHKLIYDHITVRVPGSDGPFLINPSN